jgi:hypothetical protein
MFCTRIEYLSSSSEIIPKVTKSNETMQNNEGLI